MSRLTRPAAGGLATIVAAGLLVSGQAQAGALAGTSMGPSPLGSSTAAAPTTRAVTLITGDRVLVTTAADGTPSAVVQSDGDHYSRRVGDDLYVIPALAQLALAADRLDLELFNVTGLVEQGYDDKSSQSLPFIVQGSLPQSRTASPFEVEAQLESIDSTAVSVAKDDLAVAFGQLFGQSSRSGSNVTKVWLDAKVQGTSVDLDPRTGVQQTGAPEAWALGYDGTGTKVAVLDTGYDSDHPDLAGRVIAAEDFTGDGSPEDEIGHGTHVASTVAGTGAADPSKKGMAPGADLLIGKVLTYGGGQTSWIVNGMEWAVAQGADVVNMSLGSSQPTDCTDPLAQAANELSQGNTLFVIAAGNSGMRETVSSPGCAESVLTVGALDAAGETANFSSRGSTVGDHRVKPDIAAPGVAIFGAQNDSPGGVHYVGMSGTSMATPHVVGAAALVSQAHPGWTAQQVKAALVGSVKNDANGTVYDQGAGELWTPGAIQSVVTSNPSVQLATFDWPHGADEQATRKVTYSNSSNKAVLLQLKLEDLTGADGRSVPSNVITLRNNAVSVPAHGTATVDVVARGNIGVLPDASYGEIGGRIIATGLAGSKTVQVTTAVGLWLEPETVTVTLKAINRNGVPATSGFLDITDLHQPARAVQFLTGADITMRVRAGSYFANAFIRTPNSDGTASYTWVGDPDARFTEDTTLTLDARTAHEVTVTGDRPLKIGSGSLGVQRTWDDRGWVVGNSVYAANNPTFYAAATDRADIGDFTFGTYLRAYDPAVPVPNSKYVYNLAFTDDQRVPSDLGHQVSDGSLASVTENWHAQRTQGWAPEDWSRVVMDNGTGPFFTSSNSRVAAPGTRTAYYTPGVAWQQLASASGFRTMPEVWFDPVRTYKAGDHRETDWFKLPTHTAMAVNLDGSPARIAERQGTLVGFAFPSWQDTVDGRYAMGGFGDVGNLKVYQDGALLGTSAWPAGQFDVGSEDSQLAVEVEQLRFSRSQVWELGLASVSRFEFATSRPEGDSVQALPIALPNYGAPVDLRNLAPATTDFPVSVTFQGQHGYDPGAIGQFTAKVSFDVITADDVAGFGTPLEGFTWTEVPVVQRDGHWVALVDNSAHAGGVASLWITAEDSHGTRTEQFTVNLYGVQ